MKSIEWHEQASCRELNPEWWFPVDRGVTATSRMAILICKKCPVQPQCLQAALDADEPFGIWGGMTAQERRSMARTNVYCQRCGIPHAGSTCLRDSR